MLLTTRVLAYLAGLIGSLAWYSLLAGDFNAGMWTFLGWFAVAGAVLGIRLLPLSSQHERPDELRSAEDSTGLEKAMQISSRPTLIDVAVLALISTAVAVIVMIAIGKFSDWLAPLYMLLLLAMAVGLGFLAGVMVLTPIGMLFRALFRVASGKPVASATVLVSILLLAVVGFAVSMVLAVDRSAGQDPGVGPIFAAVILGVTGIGIEIGSYPLAWTARFLMVVMVVVVIAYRASRVDPDELQFEDLDEPQPEVS